LDGVDALGGGRAGEEDDVALRRPWGPARASRDAVWRRRGDGGCQLLDRATTSRRTHHLHARSGLDTTNDQIQWTPIMMVLCSPMRLESSTLDTFLKFRYLLITLISRH
jgi:hypothetical protein